MNTSSSFSKCCTISTLDVGVIAMQNKNANYHCFIALSLAHIRIMCHFVRINAINCHKLSPSSSPSQPHQASSLWLNVSGSFLFSSHTLPFSFVTIVSLFVAVTTVKATSIYFWKIRNMLYSLNIQPNSIHPCQYKTQLTFGRTLSNNFIQTTI